MPSSSTTTSPSTVRPGWKTYSWTAEGLKFDYPASWTNINPQLSAAENADQPRFGPGDPAAFLFSPMVGDKTGYPPGSDASESGVFTGGFAIDATKDSSDQIVGSSDAGTGGVFIKNVMPVDVPGYKKLFIVEEGEGNSSMSDELAVTDAAVQVGSANSNIDDSFQSKSITGDRVSFAIGFFSKQKGDSPGTFAFLNVAADSFEKSADYATAVEVLKSIRYQ